MLTRKTFISIGVWALCLTGITIMAIFYNTYDLASLPNDVCSLCLILKTEALLISNIKLFKNIFFQ